MNIKNIVFPTSREAEDTAKGKFFTCSRSAKCSWCCCWNSYSHNGTKEQGRHIHLHERLPRHSRASMCRFRYEVP